MHKTAQSSVKHGANGGVRTSELLGSLAPLNVGHFDGEKPKEKKD